MRQYITYVVELIVAGLLLQFSEKMFWLYFFFCVMFMLDRKVDYLRALARVYQVANEAKLIAIAKKLGVSQEEIEKVLNNEVGAAKLDALEKDFRLVT